ncbi:MAG: carbonic anhydrase [Phycisphaerales bacterium]
MNAKQDLIQGNQRFLDGDLENHTWLHEQVVETGTYGQSPSIGVLSCADSRVPLELIFDQGVGDLYVVRVAGNFEDAAAAGLGHTKCGAVEATLAGKKLPGNMPTFVAAIEPAIAAAGGEMTLDAAVEANVRWQLNAMLERSAILRKAADEGRMQMFGAIYDVDTGKVRFID